MKALSRYTSDVIIIQVPFNGKEPEILLIDRKNAPFGFAIAGGFRDVLEENLNHPLVVNNTLPIPPPLLDDSLLESPLDAAKREALEETNCNLFDLTFFQVRDDINRDPRGYTISHVYFGFTKDEGVALSDAKDIVNIKISDIEDFLENNTFAFDHKEIMLDFIHSHFFDDIKNNKFI